MLTLAQLFIGLCILIKAVSRKFLKCAHYACAV
jgi:hypothetical protein